MRISGVFLSPSIKVLTAIIFIRAVFFLDFYPGVFNILGKSGITEKGKQQNNCLYFFEDALHLEFCLQQIYNNLFKTQTRACRDDLSACRDVACHVSTCINHSNTIFLFPTPPSVITCI